MHLIMDFYCKNRKLMKDTEALKSWLLKSARVAKMHPYGEPTVVDFPFPSRVGTALSAVCFLGESSIVVHTYPEFNFVFLDIFSCQEFNASEVVKFVKETFGATKTTSYLFRRGIDMETGLPVSLTPTL